MLGLGKALRLAAALFFLPAQAASMPNVSSHQAITTTLAPIDASRSRQNSVDAGEILSSSAALPQATAGSETKAPAISEAQQYTLAYKTNVYKDTETFCADWDESCVEYLSTFSDVHQVICDVGAAGPNVRVYCGGNTVTQPSSYFDFTNNVERFVSASLVSGPAAYGEVTNAENAWVTTSAPSSSSKSATSRETGSGTASALLTTTTQHHSTSNITRATASTASLPALLRPAGTLAASSARTVLASAGASKLSAIETKSSEAAGVSSSLIRIAALSSARTRTSSITTAVHRHSSSVSQTAPCPSPTQVTLALPEAVRAAISAAQAARDEALAHLRADVKLAARRIRTLEKAKAAELSRIAALRKKQLLQAVARATEKSKKDARREAHRAKERHSRGHHRARPKHHSSSHSATL
ncbi:hypothetical protein JCM8202_001642 [Rhodotorula sphaerocarpa]